MKTRRAHRRKLRFSSAKDAAPVATVKAEHAPKRPVKRRKRQHHSRHVSPVPSSTARHPNGLPTATWSNIQERFAAAKSLGEITRTTLQFFKEHEELQGLAAVPVFPIFVPASEIYRMKVPRKRRIYDVLHVLEGVGVIKRARWGEVRRRTRGGYFLYYGKAAMIQHLAEMKSNSAQVMLNFRQSCSSRVATAVEEDSFLVKAFEDQASLENWPCLVTATACFLALLFQRDYQVLVALPDMSDRLIEAKKFIGASVPGSARNESPYSDVQRRMYDVVSVLEGCNLILTSASADKSLESPLDSTGKGYQRKHIRFNYDIFTDLSVLLTTSHPKTLQWNGNSNHEELFVGTSVSPRAWQSPKLPFEESIVVSPPSACWQRLDGAVNLNTSPTFTPTRYQPEAQQTIRVQDLFSPLGKEPAVKNEWCDESLTQLGLYDALSRQYQIDWELNKQFKDIYREMWGSYSMPASIANASVEVQSHRCWIDNVDVKLADLKCHEVPAEDEGGTTANFFC
ncbi:hypothetical protein PRIC1_009413 [Phytophthora ramorum]|uniref:uncharacterized protein n=1 Tax=Phytophthora ramorum TaxID=164328 RepID=UPI0030B13FAF|nr:hypothetical protein KRP23_5830 [Phytophthora ramorum]KAH7504724.1 hypothetical protein KRP22_5209 [Phytophthora ramorum]